jgi:hypothetical protein
LEKIKMLSLVVPPSYPPLVRSFLSFEPANKADFFLASQPASRWCAAEAEKKSPGATALILTAKLASCAIAETAREQFPELLRKTAETAY